jgi:hypothetical protein
VITGEEDPVDQETEMVGGVTRGMNDREPLIAEFDGVAIGQKAIRSELITRCVSQCFDLIVAGERIG